MNFNGRLPSGATSRFLSVCRYTERRPNNSTTTLSWPRPPQKSVKEIGERLRHERERLGYTKQPDRTAARRSAPRLRTPSKTATDDPGVYRLPRLAACGFDVHVHHHRPNVTLPDRLRKTNFSTRFRDLSQRGRASIFSTHGRTRKAGARYPQAGIPPPLQELNDSRPSRAGFSIHRNSFLLILD